MPNRGASFQKDKFNGFLGVMEQVKPISAEEWNEVCHLHNNNFPGMHCTADTLCWKFQMMYLLKPLTGNPTIPPEVSQAKLINSEIKVKANILDSEDIQMTMKTTIQQLMTAILFLTLKKCRTKMKYWLLKVKQNFLQQKLLLLRKRQQNLQMTICINCSHQKNKHVIFHPFGETSCKNPYQWYRCNNKQLFAINDDSKGY
jgi:hypothetical protein